VEGTCNSRIRLGGPKTKYMLTILSFSDPKVPLHVSCVYTAPLDPDLYPDSIRIV